MSLKNTKDGYGAFTKIFHWLIVILFAFQYTSANIMIRMGRDDTVVGLTQNNFYNWHKSLGLIALFIAVLRIINRQMGRLPNWAPTLSNGEKRFIHRAEQVLYLAMFIMPISGYIYVMSGNYGVQLFGVWKLANPIGKWDALASVAKWIHILSSFALLAAIIGHLSLVLRHQFILKDGLIKRMLPGKLK